MLVEGAAAVACSEAEAGGTEMLSAVGLLCMACNDAQPCCKMQATHAQRPVSGQRLIHANP